eukprot:8971650-Alexandrium_andersonii.AAC.1
MRGALPLAVVGSWGDARRSTRHELKSQSEVGGFRRERRRTSARAPSGSKQSQPAARLKALPCQPSSR